MNAARQLAGRETLLTTLETGADLALAVHSDGRVLAVGPKTLATLGSLDHPWLGPVSHADLLAALAPGGDRHLRLWRRDGQNLRSANATVTDLRHDPGIASFIVTAIDDRPLSEGAEASGSFLRSLGTGSVRVADGWEPHEFATFAEQDFRERQLEALLGEVGDFIAVLARDATLRWTSSRAREALAAWPGDRGLLHAVHRDDRGYVTSLWRQAMAGDGVCSTGSVRLATGSGPWRRARLTLTNRLSDPAIAGVVLHASDVTSAHISAEIRKGTQDALLTALNQDRPAASLEAICASLERLLRQEHSHAAVTVTYPDTDARGTAETRRVRSPGLFGVPVPDPPAAPLAEVLIDPLPDSPTGFTHSWTVPLRGVAGRPVGCLQVLVDNGAGGPSVHAQRALDRYVPLAGVVIARHLARVATAESDTRFRSVFHDTTVPSALVSVDGLFLEVNLALATLLERPAADLVGTSVTDLEQDNPDQGADVRTARRWTTPGGRALWVEKEGADVRGADGQLLYRVEHYLDVTCRRVTEDEVRLLNDMLCARIAELDAAQTGLASAFRKITQVREDERRSLAVTLHDNTVQQLIVATWLLDEVDPDDVNADVRAVRTQLQATIDGVRGVITDLRPAALDSMSLAAALENRARYVLGPGVALTVSDELPQALPDELRTLVLRTALEALRNIRKHAQASVAEIALGQLGSTVVVKVVDNGRGFDSARAGELGRAGHIGVSSMREEIALAGGRFHIGARSDTLAGTEVSFSLPLLPATNDVWAPAP